MDRPGAPASRLLAVVPPLALMAVIFALSAQPGLDTGLGAWDTVARKLAHMAEFGLLWFLLWRATGYERPALAAAVTLLYAATDELHQATVPDRVGSPFDWAIDAAGVGVAALLVLLWTRRRTRAGNTPTASRAPWR